MEIAERELGLEGQAQCLSRRTKVKHFFPIESIEECEVQGPVALVTR